MIASPPLRRAAQTGDTLWLMLALALGAVLYFWNLTAASLYSDEAFTFFVSSLPLQALLHVLAVQDYHPPLFYAVTHMLMNWLHWPLFAYRFFTAAAGLVTIAATWGFARRLFGPLAAALAAFFVALEPALLQYDRLYRMHAVTVALCALSWWLIVEIQRAEPKKRRWLWAAYGLSAIVLPYVDYLGILVLVTQAVYATFQRRTLAPLFACLALALLAFVPWLPSLSQQFPSGGLALSRPALDSGLLASVRGAFAAGAPDSWLAIPHFDASVTLFVAAIMIAGAWFGRSTPLPYWLSLLPLQIVLSLLLGKNLAYFPRYLLMTVPALAVAVGCVVAHLAVRGHRFWGAAAAAAILGLLALGTSHLLFDEYYQLPDWHQVDALLRAHAKPADAIVLDEGYEFLVVRNYPAFRNHPLLVFMNPNDFKPVLRWLAAHPERRVWYIEHQNFYWDPQKKIASSLARQRPVLLRWSERRQSAVDAVNVALFDRIPMIKVR